MNVVVLTGNICKDIEIKYTKDRKSMLLNTIAVRKNIKNKDDKYESDFINFVCFGNKADYLSNYGKKGDKIEIKGELRVDNYENKEGKKIYNTYVYVNELSILTSRIK